MTRTLVAVGAAIVLAAASFVVVGATVFAREGFPFGCSAGAWQVGLRELRVGAAVTALTAADSEMATFLGMATRPNAGAKVAATGVLPAAE